MCKPECTDVLLKLTAATPVDASNITLGYHFEIKHTLLTAWKMVLIKWDFSQSTLPERNKRNNVDCFEVCLDWTLICDLAQLYLKSDISLCLKVRDLILQFISLSIGMVALSWEDYFSE